MIKFSGMKLSREDAIKIIEIITNQPDPYWDDIIETWIIQNDIPLEDEDQWPTIYDVVGALGISESEYETALKKK